MSSEEEKTRLKQQIFDLVSQYYELAHKPGPFEPGTSQLPYAGRFYDQREMINLIDASLDFWLTAGPYSAQFEKRMRDYFGAEDFALVNSGSSANLLMVSTLRSRELSKLLNEKDPPPLEPDDEVITPAVTFPTTLTPIIQNQLVPVFVDCDIRTCNINAELIEEAIGPRTRAIFVPHTLGNPCDMKTIVSLAQKHRLWLLEDGCDALGATFDGKLVGTFGALSSLSFYPAHHMTMGEGGAVVINHPRLRKTVRSLRDWGRDCWCDPGVSNSCGKRFGWTLGELPAGYDHKYIYSNIGYNLKVTDMQAAVGVAQLEKLTAMIEARRRNFWHLFEGLKPLEENLILPLVDERANPSPFGFAVTARESSTSKKLIQHLENARIETRRLFGGNILRQPAFTDIKKRVHGSLENSDRIMKDSFFVGVSPRLTEPMINYMVESFKSFFGNKS